MMERDITPCLAGKQRSLASNGGFISPSEREKIRMRIDAHAYAAHHLTLCNPAVILRVQATGSDFLQK